HAWKDFKWKLNINYVKKDKTPFEDYPELKKEWWPDFVEWVTSDEYIALGEKGKQSQSMNKFRQKLGRRSYTVQKRKWAKEDAQALTEGKSIPFQDMPDGRHKDWARARNPSGDVNITESHPIIQKIVDLNEKSVAGTFTPLDNMDILATAIGSNHPGRTTGVSAYVGLGMGLAQGDGPRKKKRRRTKEYVKRIVDEYEAKFEKLTALCHSMERRLNNSESCSSSKFVDTPDHATHHSVDSLQEVMKCKLVVQIGPQSVVVARGQAYPPKDVVTVHGIERRDDHTKVQVDFVFDNFLEFPLPIPIAGGDMFTLGEAKNSFVLWPKSGIQLAEETTVHAKPQQVPHTSPQVLHHTPEKDKMPTPTMGTEDIDVTHSASNVIEFSDVFHIYNDLALDISLHRSWMLCMRKIDKYRGIVGFLDPEMIILKRINEEADEVEAYIVKALLAQQDKECIFVVCQEGYHWALLVIFPKWNTVYNIDSKGYQSPSCYSIKKLFDEWLLFNVLRAMHKRELDEKVRDALHLYIEARGINEKLFRFLQAWLYVKDHCNLVRWFKSVGSFISDQSQSKMTNTVTSMNQYILSLSDDKQLVPGLISLIEQGTDVLRVKALLFVALLCKNSRRWLPHFFCNAKLISVVDRLGKEKEGFIHHCTEAFVQLVASLVPGILDTVSSDIQQVMVGKRHGPVTALAGRAHPKSTIHLFPLILHLLGSASFKHRVVTGHVLLQLANLIKILEAPFQVLFKNLTVDIKDVKPTSLLKDRLREVEGNPKLGSLGPQLQYS
ncbi:hypothetical protein ACJX0J_022285, partial [Zea mays]